MRDARCVIWDSTHGMKDVGTWRAIEGQVSSIENRGSSSISYSVTSVDIN